jgi:hypothetical protein
VNLAFPAILLFLALLPGFLWRRTFRVAERTLLDYTPFARATLEATLCAMVIHAVVAAGFLWLGPYSLSASAYQLLVLVLSDRAGPEVASVSRAVSREAGVIVAYFALTFALALVAGLGMRKLVTRLGWDRRTSGFWLRDAVRFDTPWYYLFKGYDEDTPPSGVLIATVVDLDAGSTLYVGLLTEYFLTEEGQLDRFVLAGASRRLLKDDTRVDAAGNVTAAEEFYPVEGNYLVIRYADCKTLNVLYLVPAEPTAVEVGEPAATLPAPVPPA